MRENTFDIPSVKFCIVNDFFSNYIPFEYVDGLTIDDIPHIYRRGFYFYAITLPKDFAGEICDQCQWIFVIENFYWSALQTQKLERIDKVIEKRFEEKYNQVDEKTQRIYNCFFERYQDGSYEKTKERVKRLKDGK